MDEQQLLFPALPEDLTELSDEALDELLAEHEVALSKIEAEDPEYVGGLKGDEIIDGLKVGVEQIRTIKAEKASRAEQAEAYAAAKAELLSEAREGDEEGGEGEGGEGGEATTEVAAEAASEELAAAAEGEEGGEGGGEGGDGGEVAGEPAASATPLVPVETAGEPLATAAGESSGQTRVVYRRPPVATPERQPDETKTETALVAAAGLDGVRADKHLDRVGLAEAMIEVVKRRAKPQKHPGGVEEKILVATAHYDFPPELILRANDIEGNNAKIRGIGSHFLGDDVSKALVASGGLCAPLTPFYDIPDFAVTSRPVRDSLPSFQAERGGVSVPSVSTIGAIDTAITVIEADEDALGGTFATKSCQDMDCPTWTDVAVGIIAHCREYGNLNSRAWPEGIAHENNLTMAAHARTAETRLLDRIKSLSLQVTTNQGYAALPELVFYITRAAAGIRNRLRMDDVRLRALLPLWLIDLLVADNAATQFDRYEGRAQLIAVLRDAGIEPAFYLDSPSDGTSQLFADEAAGPLDFFPAEVQWAIFVEGTFLHLDAGTLELGLVRDSTLNSTNDYQVFGETFENVARIGPAQAALWVTSDLCASGQYPALAAVRNCS